MTVDKNTLRKLVRRYNKAVKDKEEEFRFEGELLLTSYAKYLITYIKTLKL